MDPPGNLRNSPRSLVIRLKKLGDWYGDGKVTLVPGDDSEHNLMGHHPQYSQLLTP